MDPESKGKLKILFKEINTTLVYFKNYVKKTITFEDKVHTIRVLIEIFLLMKITSLLNSKIIFFFIFNLFIFYSIIDGKFPHFLFKTRMAIKQIIEGIIVLIICIFPIKEGKKQKTE